MLDLTRILNFLCSAFRIVLRQFKAGALILLAFILGSCAHHNNSTSAPEFVVETSDISNFLRARKIAQSSDDPIRVYKEQYFEKGTAGLQDMFVLRIKSVENFVQAVERFPEPHDALAALEPRKEMLVEEIHAIYERYREIYPPVGLPSVYFVVSGMTTGGTVSDNGLLIGTEAVIYAFGSIDALGPVVAHELVHFQQPNVEGKDALASVGGDAATLLGQAINEGAADFLGELASGRHMNIEAHAYGLEHEAQLWSEFKPVMQGDELVPWMSGRSNEGVWAERPRDLGYFIGYRIVEAYYSRAVNKQAAIADILNISDSQKFLAASGYEENVARLK